MIKTYDKNRVMVGLGVDVGVGVIDNNLVLVQLKNENGKIGDKVNKEDIDTKHMMVILDFRTKEDVDYIIKSLNDIRDNIK